MQDSGGIQLTYRDEGIPTELLLPGIEQMGYSLGLLIDTVQITR